MVSIINTARIKQRSVVIALFNLKKASGKFHHNLISEVLRHHHVPDQIQQLIQSLYSKFQTSIVAESLQTPFHYSGMWCSSAALPRPADL